MNELPTYKQEEIFTLVKGRVKLRALLIPLFTGLLIITNVQATTIYVPADQSTIQAGIDAAINKDTVLVDTGKYVENINFNGKNIVLGSHFLTTGDTIYISKTIIDGKNIGSVVTFENGEDSSAVIRGFTLTNDPMDRDGEGIYIKDSSPTLSFLIITENNSGTKLEKVMIYGGSGGGIYFENSHSRISNVHITKNTAMDGGGIFAIQSDLDLCNVFVYKNMVLGGGVVGLANGAGISSILSNLKITNSLIAGNAGKGTVVYGGGICAYSSTISLTNVTIAENNIGGSSGSSEYYCGGGIYLSGNSEIYIVNSIVWNDNPEEIYLSGNPSNVVLAAFSDIQGGKDSIVCNDEDSVYWLNNNIDKDPLFIDAENGDFHLQAESPCIDRGIAIFVWKNDTLVDLSTDEYVGLAPDMGAFESSSIVKISEQPAPPHKFILYQNFPNPFNPVTTIKFRLPRQSDIRIDIYNINGAFIENLYNGNRNAGIYTIQWNASRYPSGIYFVKLNSGSQLLTNKLLLLK